MIRKTLDTDIPAVMAIYDAARAFMRAHGNATQWPEGTPSAEQLAAEGIHARVINIHTIKPLDEEIVLKAAKECGKVITVEEHSIIGGLGEAVCSVVSEKLPVPVRRIGVNDEFGHSGPAAALLEEMGLCASHIAEVVRETVKG